MTQQKEQLAMFDFQVVQPQDVKPEEYEAWAKAAESGSFFSEPGSYELEVTSIENKGTARTDSSWVRLQVTLTGITGQTIKQFINVPTVNVNFKKEDGSTTSFPYKLYKDFLTALGLDVTVGNVLTHSRSLYVKNKIIGMRIKAQLGYRNAYAKYEGKDESGNTQYSLVYEDKTVTDAETQKPLLWNSKDAVENHAKVDLGITKFDSFIQILQYEACPNPSQVSTLSGGSKKNVGNF